MNVNHMIDNDIHNLLSNNGIDCNCHDIKKILVLSGGSIKGLAQAGALYCLEKHNILQHIDTFACTSAGAIVGMMIIVGIRPIEILHFFIALDTNKVTNSVPLNLLSSFGFDNGERVMVIFQHILEGNNYNSNITFGEFYEKTKKKFIVTGTCVNTKKAVYFSHETTPDIRVVDAVRASSSIPLVFVPQKIENMLYIDGGCIDNYPIKLFDHCLDQVIGIMVSDHRKKVDVINNLEQYFSETVQCLYEGQIISVINGYEKQTVFIECIQAIGSIEERSNALFDNGYQIMEKNIGRFIKLSSINLRNFRVRTE